jgi:phospholipid/cholesterol/gamma-HCH transport system permease protein
MFDFVSNFGRVCLSAIHQLGQLAALLCVIIKNIPAALLRPRLIMTQTYQLGVLSLPIIMVAGFFVGMVLCFQGYVNLVKFGAAASVGTVVALSLLRELGPVLTSLLYTGRACSALTAEIGLMRATEQWASYEIMSVDPRRYILAPRFIAGIIVLPLLTSIFCAIGITAGFLVGSLQLGVDAGAYWSQMRSAVDFSNDIFDGVILKAFFFALVCNLIALYEGMNGMPTAEGVAKATTNSVVKGSLSILGVDFILTTMFFAV